mmetsp:Transcript_281/g.412  ORF Transcript_281/g.412 Transcript_281/m.412 type:complete len:675 (+) Transcript_281:3-2027(+)
MSGFVEHPESYPAVKTANSLSLEDFKALYDQSINKPELFWSMMSEKYLEWISRPCTSYPMHHGEFLDGDVNWFAGGKLNACFNCVDKHIKERASKVALLWEGDEPGQNRSITYSELLKSVCKIANSFTSRGVRKGDVVTIYMPMIPEIAMVMLACARIGAVHSIVFAGFSADSLRDRMVDCNSRYLVVSDEGRRGGKTLRLKDIADQAVASLPQVHTVFAFSYGATHSPSLLPSPSSDTPHPPSTAHMQAGRDVWMHQLMAAARPHCPCEPMDSEDPLFILYTSGSTGKPKGVLHTTAGYLLNAAMTTKYSFDLQEEDVYCCAADCGWITGHSYIVYGPLCNGATSVMFESIPTYPNPYRYWDMIQRLKITQFYTAPTAIRALMRFPTEPLASMDLSSLRVLGSVGEPINPQAWRWLHGLVGGGRCSVVDTYWQTETGAHLATNLPGVVDMKPGSCAFPYFGIEFAVVDPTTGEELLGGGVEGVLCIKKPWPSIARTVYGDHDRYLNVYMKPYPGLYFTGDGCRRDNDGYYWITGRVDDVINPSGHRLGTAEIESALVACKEVSEAAVVGFPHEIKGEGIMCYIILKEGFEGSDALTVTLKNAVRSAIGPIATPDYIIYSDLPKTRSGKIMRRILRKIAAGEESALGDTSTLADPTVVDRLVEQFKVSAGKKSK